MSQQINLYNPLFRPQKKYFAATHMAQAMLVLLIGALLVYGYVWKLSAQLDQRATETARAEQASQQRLVEATARYGPRQPSKILQEEVARMEEQSKSRTRLLDLMGRGELGNTHGFSGYFLALARQSQSSLWLTGFQVVGTGSEMTITGRALQPELVPAFINRLKNEPLLAGQTFSTLDIKLPPAEPVSGKPAVVPPYIEFSLRQGEGAAK